MIRIPNFAAFAVGTLVAVLPTTATSQQITPNVEKEIIDNIAAYNSYHTSCSSQEKVKWPVHYIHLVKKKNIKPNISLDLENFVIEEEDRSACTKLGRKITRGKTKIVELRNNIYVISKVSYRSKYAKYDFLEQYVVDKFKKITKSSMGIKIAERVFFNNAENKSGKFILLDESDYNNFLPDIDKYGALNRDVIFEKMLAKSASQITTSIDTSDKFVAVFIPNFFVKPGSIITIEYLYKREGGSRNFHSYGQDFKVNKVQPYIFAATTAWASYSDGGTVEMSAFLDGEKIHTQTFKLGR